MTKKVNCWEFHNCGREVGGSNMELGVCPTASEALLDGFHGGKNGGRACWAIAGTLCGGKPKGIIAQKLRDCTMCDFHHLVIEEEENYESAALFLKRSRTEDKKKTFKEPSFIKHIYAKSKMASEDGVESLYITLLIAWTSLCPSISMLEGSKRLCREDLVDELMIIDAVAELPQLRATNLFMKTIFKSFRKQIGNYFEPLFDKFILNS